MKIKRHQGDPDDGQRTKIKLHHQNQHRHPRGAKPLQRTLDHHVEY